MHGLYLVTLCCNLDARTLLSEATCSRVVGSASDYTANEALLVRFPTAVRLPRAPETVIGLEFDLEGSRLPLSKDRPVCYDLPDPPLSSG